MVLRNAVIIGSFFWGVILFTLSGCSVSVPSPWNEGYVMTVGDEKGVNAIADMYAAAISEGKATPDKKGSYYQLREEQTKARRIVIGGKKND